MFCYDGSVKGLVNVKRFVNGLSKICCFCFLVGPRNEWAGRPVQNFVWFFNIVKIRLIQSVLSRSGHSKSTYSQVPTKRPPPAY